LNITLYSSFPEASQAQEAISALREQGAKVQDLTAFFPETSSATAQSSDDGETLMTAAEAGVGVGIMAALTSLMIPGIGIASGGGTIVASLAALAGTALGIAVTGGTAAFLESHGVDALLARKSAKALKSGSSVVLVDCPTGTLLDIRVRDILLRHKASVVSRSARARSQLICKPD
jgi:hypothetical protein